MEISRNRQFPSFSAPIWGVTGKCQSLGNIRWSIQVLVSQDKEWPWDTWLETEVEIIRNGKDTPENDSGRESWGEMCFSSKASGQETHNRWWFVTQHHICHVCITWLFLFKHMIWWWPITQVGRVSSPRLLASFPHESSAVLSSPSE